MVGLVQMVALARREHGEIRRIAGRSAALLGADRRRQEDADEAVVARSVKADVKSFVFLFIDEPVGGRRGAQHMRLHALTEESNWILVDVENRPVVVGPGDVGFDILDRVGEDLAGRQVLDLQPVLAAADDILGISQQAIIRADRIIADREEIVTLGHFGLVEEYLLKRRHAALAAGEDRVARAGLETLVIIIAVVEHRDVRIVLLDAADELSVELVLKRPQRRHIGIDIGIFGIEVADHLGIFAGVVAQPIIFVDPVDRAFHDMRLLGRDRRRRQ